jgi:lipoate-protein ligase A
MFFVSKTTNPFLNLAFEDFLFRNVNQKHIIFLYKNEKCIVLGRNQNPWKEINFKKTVSNNVRLVRRNSGGGTVYHDLGNSNYCHIMPRETFDRSTRFLYFNTASI